MVKSLNRKRGVTPFRLFDSLLAGDCAIFFETREDMVTGKSCLFNHLRKFGLKMHVGSGTAASKTEAVSYPASTGPYEDGDTTPFTVSRPDGKDLGFVSFTKEFKYLGPIVHSSLTSDADMDKRIRSAVAVFGALRSVLCNFALEENLRGEVYSVPVLTVPRPREDLLAKLRSFHNRCCRAMCRITMKYSRHYRIPSVQLYRRLGIAAVEQHTAVVCPAGRATCRACPCTGSHVSCLQVSSRAPGQQGLR